MENDHPAFETRPGQSMDWYTEEFIANSVLDYLLENGYKIHKDPAGKVPVRQERIITASKFFTKEVIGIKGLQINNNRSILLKVLEKSVASHQAKSWFAETLFHSLVNFGKYYSDDNADVAIALPNLEKYKAIIVKVQDYFADNNLSLKVYLVNENGTIEVSNLNSKHT